jgi:hypothetical protein
MGIFAPAVTPNAAVISSARLGGLHHRYGWEQAA